MSRDLSPARTCCERERVGGLGGWDRPRNTASTDYPRGRTGPRRRRSRRHTTHRADRGRAARDPRPRGVSAPGHTAASRGAGATPARSQRSPPAAEGPQEANFRAERAPARTCRERQRVEYPGGRGRPRNTASTDPPRGRTGPRRRRSRRRTTHKAGRGRAARGPGPRSVSVPRHPAASRGAGAPAAWAWENARALYIHLDGGGN